MKIGNFNPQQCSFFISGTKLGANVFISHNINEDLQYLSNKVMVDIRGENIAIRPPYNQVFFGITHTANYTLLNCFRTIEDFVGRPGFYAVSIALPSKKAMMPGKAVELLRKLNDLYYELYIRPNSAHPNQILKEVEEKISPFVNMVTTQSYNLINVDYYPSYDQKPQIAYKYSNESELNQIFDFCHKDDLVNTENAFIFSHDQLSMCPTNLVIQSSLPEDAPTFSFNIVPLFNGIAVSSTRLICRKNGQLINMPENSRVLSGIKQNEAVEITVLAQGFETKIISKHELFSQSGSEQNGIITVRVNLSKSVAPQKDFGSSTPPPTHPRNFVLAGIIASTSIILTLSILYFSGVFNKPNPSVITEKPIPHPKIEDSLNQVTNDVSNNHLKDSIKTETDKEKKEVVKKTETDKAKKEVVKKTETEKAQEKKAQEKKAQEKKAQEKKAQEKKAQEKKAQEKKAQNSNTDLK